MSISLVSLAERFEQAMKFLMIGAEPLSAEGIFIQKNWFRNIWRTQFSVQ